MNLRKLALPLLTVLVLLTAACPQRETISRINGDPARYHNKEVSIAGTVTDSYGVLGTGVYQVEDETGKLLVVTRRGTPSRGARIVAKGYIRTGFSLSGKSYGTVLEETGRSVK